MKIIYVIFGCICLVSCTKEIDTPFPEVSPQIVLNGILHPDSTICVSLTRSQTLTDSLDFVKVSNAAVLLYENSNLIGELYTQNGQYRLDYYPQESAEYRIEASVPEYGIVRATDVIPMQPVANSCYTEPIYTKYTYTGIRVEIQDDPNQENYYWLGATLSQYKRLGFDDRQCVGEGEQRICAWVDSSTVVTEQLSGLSSFSTLPDIFNSYIDTFSDGIRQYAQYMRMDDSAINSTNITLDITSYSPLYRFNEMSQLDSNQSVVLETINASQHYDRYLKSSMIYYLNNSFGEDSDQPGIFNEPTRIYSNVENGLGIFAAYNSVSIAVEDFPCQ